MPSVASVLRIGALALLIAFLLAPQSFAPVFAPLNHHGAPAIYDQGDLLTLALAHLGTVLLAAAASTIVAVGLGILVTRASGAEFLPLSRTLVNIGQTFPPVAVLAVAVPLVGFGEAPTLIALFAYGLLPIFENTIAGLQSCPPAIIEAAKGMGMSARERLTSVGTAARDAPHSGRRALIARHQCRHRYDWLHSSGQGAWRGHHRRPAIRQHRVHSARRALDCPDGDFAL
jgi:osmoprotectant transport system permease protein